jgi:hypothetical protein
VSQVEISATSCSIVQITVRRCVVSRKLKKEEAMARVGPQRDRKEGGGEMPDDVTLNGNM